MSEFERAEAYEESYRQTFAEIDALRENGSYEEASEIEENTVDSANLEIEYIADLFLDSLKKDSSIDYLQAKYLITEDGYEIEECILRQDSHDYYVESSETVVLRGSALWRLMDEHLAKLY